MVVKILFKIGYIALDGFVAPKQSKSSLSFMNSSVEFTSGFDPVEVGKLDKP